MCFNYCFYFVRKEIMRNVEFFVSCWKGKIVFFIRAGLVFFFNLLVMAEVMMFLLEIFMGSFWDYF